MKSILIPTDFSADSHKAIREAARLAEQFHTGLVLVHINPIPLTDPEIPTTTVAEIIEVQEKAAAESMAKLKTEVLGYFNGSLITYSRTGMLADEIELIANETGAGMLVMNTHGAGGFLEKLLIGSNTAKVISHTHRPVLVIPENAANLHIRKILYASDLEHDDKPALQHLQEFAGTAGAKITVLHVKNDSQLDIMNDHPIKSGIVHTLGDTLGGFEQVESTDVKKAILDYASTHQIDLLVATRQNYGFIDGLFHKSVTAALAYEAHLPLLIYHL